MRILFLYNELADYTIACLKALKNADKDVSIKVIHFPVNPEAPFRFDFGNIGEFICVNDFESYASLKESALLFKPDKIICGGWVNKWYVRLCFELRNRSLCILALDNHWQNTFKQKAIGLLSGFTLKKIFKKVFVPGAPQIHYAEKLSFRTGDIIPGFYCCDTDRFNGWYENSWPVKENGFPKRLLCVARYIPAKGYTHLWNAFIEWKKRSNTDWELWCAGTGEEFPLRVEHPAIRHLGFLQKDEWTTVIQNTGVFILPSLSEPWGVVVQEFAAAGYPLLLSNNVGAGSLFLHKDNGFTFDPLVQEDMIDCFDKLARCSDAALLAMGKKSHENAQLITPYKWSQAVLLC